MSDKIFEGKTHAEWLALRGKGGLIGCPPEKDIQRALLWFDNEDKKARHEIEESRFQTQLAESRRQGALTRLIAWLALVVSAGALVVSILRRDTPVSLPPTQFSPKATGSVTSGTSK